MKALHAGVIVASIALLFVSCSPEQQIAIVRSNCSNGDTQACSYLCRAGEPAACNQLAYIQYEQQARIASMVRRDQAFQQKWLLLQQQQNWWQYQRPQYCSSLAQRGLGQSYYANKYCR